MRARGIEVAQRDPLDAMRHFEMRQGAFDCQLGFAVGVDRLLLEGLDNRHRRRFTVDRAGGREDEALDAGIAHRLEHRERAGNIVLEIFERPADRFTDGEPGGEVHHRVGAVLDQQSMHRGTIMNRGLDERHALRQ